MHPYLQNIDPSDMDSKAYESIAANNFPPISTRIWEVTREVMLKHHLTPTLVVLHGKDFRDLEDEYKDMLIPNTGGSQKYVTYMGLTVADSFTRELMKYESCGPATASYMQRLDHEANKPIYKGLKLASIEVYVKETGVTPVGHGHPFPYTVESEDRISQLQRYWMGLPNTYFEDEAKQKFGPLFLWY